MSTVAGIIHKSVEPIEWLIGKWICKNGEGIYPTIKPFEYYEEIEFKSYGQPLLHYEARSWNIERTKPMHFESGFLRIQPGTNNLAFIVAHNFGLTIIEEGAVTKNRIDLTSKHINRMSFASDPSVLKTERTLIMLNENSMEQIIKMETANTPLQQHLKCNYEKVSQ